MTNQTFKLLTIAIGCVAAAMAFLPAQAQQGARTIVVETGDLDLTTAAGERTLKLRLMHAVSENCPIGAKCRAPALANAYERAYKLIEAARRGEPVPNAIRVAPR